MVPQWRVGQYLSGCHLQGGTKGWREGGTCLSSVSRPLIDFSLPCDLTKTSPDLLGCALFGFMSQLSKSSVDKLKAGSSGVRGAEGKGS